jgi:hypothetical protein
MAAKNGTLWTIIYAIAFSIWCIILGAIALIVLTEPLTPISLDSHYHPVATCFHEHRI